MHINISASPSSPTPPFDEELGRITVFLGANGAGKSKLLQAVFGQAARLVPRKNLIKLHPLGGVGNMEFRVPMPVVAAEDELNKSITNAAAQSNNSAARVPEQHILNALHAIDHQQQLDELAAYKRHRADPDNVAMPEDVISSFDALCEIFNKSVEVDLSYNIEQSRFLAKSKLNTDTEYPINELSSGEQWIFRVLPAFIKFKNEPMIVFVDEPETTLNEQLAVDFWSTIENERPNWKFIYATHNVSFASRNVVDGLFVIRSGGETPLKLSHITELSRSDKRQLMGIGPRLVQSRKALFVEGEDAALDQRFYRVILGKDDVLISALGSCNEVKKAVDKSDYWQQLELDDLLIGGAIDRDYRGHEWSQTREGKLVVLDLHDLESYLCLPKLLAIIGNKIGGEINEEAYSSAILSHAKRELINTIVKHANERFPVGEVVSIARNSRSELQIDNIAAAFITRRNDLVASVSEKYSDESIKTAIEDITNSIQSAIDTKDFDQILCWYSGKPLFEAIRKMAKLTDKMQAVELIDRCDLVQEIPQLARLRIKLQQLFSA